MITGEIKNRIDSIWDTFWTGGITNSMDILAQMTYLFFMKMLDDAQMTKEANANAFGVAVKDPTFKEGLWHNPDTDKDVLEMEAQGKQKEIFNVNVANTWFEGNQVYPKQ